MRLASFNLENLFDRAKAFNEDTIAAGKVVLDKFGRPQTGPVEVVANGRDDWIGWLELKTERVNAVATQNTARVIREVNADVMGTIEVDNRIAVLRFNDQVLPDVNANPYPHVMVIDGNDDRGIDVGLMSRFPVGTIRSHVDDLNGDR